MAKIWTVLVVLTGIIQIISAKVQDDLLEQYVDHVGAVNELDSNYLQTNQRYFNYKNRDSRNYFYKHSGRSERRKRNVPNQSDMTEWTHSQVLDKKGHVVLRWQPRHQEILFRVEARTIGYVGIGFSPNGSMEGADIVIGWIDDRTGRVFLMDCHGVTKGEPVRDEIDNYTLIMGVQNSTHTVIEFRRVLDTCDPNDYVLTGDTVRVIWALNNEDPEGMSNFQYHNQQRGVQSLHLLGPTPVAPSHHRTSKFRKWDVTLDNFKVNNEMQTIYWCKVFKAPTLQEKHHITGFEPIIGDNHSAMVHHMIMHECELDAYPNRMMWETFAQEEGRPCYSNMPAEWDKCLTPLVAWAVGSKGEYFPNHVGLPLAGKKLSYYMLEVHFDNPLMKSARDTTGLRLHYTNELRDNEGGILITGVAPSTLHFIPPYQDEYKTAGYCSLGCTKEVFPRDGINVVSVMLHSHLAGRKLKLRHLRGGKELPPLAEDNHYDFNYQQSRSLSQDTKILPGDGLITECTYSTVGRSRPTLGGYSTKEEMCLAFVLHYPRTELAGCYSIPPVKTFFDNLGVRNFYGKNMTDIEKALLEGSAESETVPSTTLKPFEIRPGDELSLEANQRAINALKKAKDYSIEGETDANQNIFDKLVIKDPEEFRNKTFTSHLQNLPYKDPVFTKKLEEYFYTGLHLTFCRKRDDSLAIKEKIEQLPTFIAYEDKANIQCSYKSKRSSSSASIRQINFLLNIVLLFCFYHTYI